MFTANRGKGSGYTPRRRFGRIAATVAVGLTGVATSLVGITMTSTSASAEPIPPNDARCVQIVWSTADENVRYSCVADEQVLLGNLYPGALVSDGYYGPITASVVRHFQGNFRLLVDGVTGPQTWGELCAVNAQRGFRGIYWNAAGCPTL